MVIPLETLNNLQQRYPLYGYLFAFTAVLLAASLRWALLPIFSDQLPFFTFLMAVILVTWLGGMKPAVVSAIFGLIFGFSIFGSLRVYRGDSLVPLAWGATAYSVLAIAIIATGESMRRLYRESIIAIDRLKDEGRRKNQFLATLSHELRNPLAPLRNGLEMLRLAKGDPQITGQVQEIMERQFAQLVHLIDDLLEASRISCGKIELKCQAVNLESIIRQAIESTQSMIDREGQRLIVEIEEAPVIVHGDSTRLIQVFGNILNNASKYSKTGGKISVRLSKDSRFATVRIKDDGVGIPSSELSSVFDIFTQVIDTKDRSQGGLGIGLSLVKGLVELHGGTVSAHSDGSGRGSEFVVSLPLFNAELDSCVEG